MKTTKNEKEFNDIDFASTIYNIRSERNLTQKQLAEIIGISDRTISKWERGDTVPDLYSIRNICNKLNVSPSSIVKSKKTLKDRLNTFKRDVFKVFNYLLKNIIIICFAITFFFLLIYFINNYNMVKVYNIKYESDNINIKHSYLIKTKSINLLTINKISLDKIKYTPKTIKIELYTYYYGDKYILYEGNSLDDIFIEEAKNSKDILNNDVINSMKNSLYLDIYATNDLDEETKYSSILTLQKELSSNKLTYDKAALNDKYDNRYLSFLNIDKDYSLENHIVDNNLEVEEDISKLKNENKLESLGYQYDAKRRIYYKDEDDYRLEYLVETKTFKYIRENGTDSLEVVYNIDGKRFLVKHYKGNKNFLMVKKINYQNNSLFCRSGNCEKYKNEISKILSDYQEIIHILK